MTKKVEYVLQALAKWTWHDLRQEREPFTELEIQNAQRRVKNKLRQIERTTTITERVIE